jgi:hypothetical protein
MPLNGWIPPLAADPIAVWPNKRDVFFSGIGEDKKGCLFDGGINEHLWSLGGNEVRRFEPIKDAEQGLR